MKVIKCLECLKWGVTIEEDGSCLCCSNPPKPNVRSRICAHPGCSKRTDLNAQISVEAHQDVDAEAAIEAVGRLFHAMFYIHGGGLCEDHIEEYLNRCHSEGHMGMMVAGCASELRDEKFRGDWE